MYFLLSNQTKHISETALVTSTYIFCCWPCYLLANEKLFIDTHTAQKTPVHLIFVEYTIILLSNASDKKELDLPLYMKSVIPNHVHFHNIVYLRFTIPII